MIMLPNIPPDQQENYSYAYDVLMDSYGIPEIHRDELQDILYYFVLKFESANQIIYEREQAVNALNFFKEYQEVKTITINQYKEKHPNTIDTYDPLTEFLTVNIRSKFLKAQSVMNYYGLALETVNFLYEKIKSSDQLLHTYLKNHPIIPSSSMLNSLIEEIELKAQYEFLDDIRTFANDLNEYLKLNLAQLVSRHRYHLIFELLYLCDVFKYIGKINKSKGSYYSIKSNPNKDNQYLISKRFSESEKYNVVNGIFKNENRSEAYKRETLKRLREK